MKSTVFTQWENLMGYIFGLWVSGKISKVHMQDIYKDEYENFVTEPMPVGYADTYYDKGLEELELIGG